jgi:hypothetical protein
MIQRERMCGLYADDDSDRLSGRSTWSTPRLARFRRVVESVCLADAQLGHSARVEPDLEDRFGQAPALGRLVSAGSPGGDARIPPLRLAGPTVLVLEGRRGFVPELDRAWTAEVERERPLRGLIDLFPTGPLALGPGDEDALGLFLEPGKEFRPGYEAVTVDVGAGHAGFDELRESPG